MTLHSAVRHSGGRTFYCVNFIALAIANKSASRPDNGICFDCVVRPAYIGSEDAWHTGLQTTCASIGHLWIRSCGPQNESAREKIPS
jgi:hypothetical protein